MPVGIELIAVRLATYHSLPLTHFIKLGLQQEPYSVIAVSAAA